MIIFARANIVGYFVYFVANYLALFLSGKSILNIWNNHGIYPCAYIYELPWYASVLFWLSTTYWILAIYGSITSASKTTYQELKGDHFFSISFNEQIMSTPGDRSQDQLFTDRKGSDTPDDFINSVGGSFLYGGDYKLSN